MPNFLKILMQKGILQILKYHSVLIITFILPLILVVIYGYALRMDVKLVSLAIVTDTNSQIEREISHRFIGLEYYNVRVTPSLQEARELFDTHEVQGILEFESAFAAKFIDKISGADMPNPQIFILKNGSQAQLAELRVGYAKALIG